MNSFFSPTSTFATPTSQPPPMNIQQPQNGNSGSNMGLNYGSGGGGGNQLHIQTHSGNSGAQGVGGQYFYQGHQKRETSYIPVPGEDMAGTSGAGFGGASWNQGQPMGFYGNGGFSGYNGYNGYGGSSYGVMPPILLDKNRRNRNQSGFDNDTEMK